MKMQNRLIGKIIFSLLAFVFMFSGLQAPVFAYDVPKQIRVGLETKNREKDSITISNKLITVGYDSGGLYHPSEAISSDSGFAFTPATLYYISIEKEYGLYSEALAQTEKFEKLGFQVAPCLVAVNVWKVYVGGFANEKDTLDAANKISDVMKIVEPSNKTILMSNGEKVVAVFDNATLYPQILAVDGEFVLIGDRKYRELIEFGRYENAKVSAVNVVGLKSYLYSVVPSEMPSSWHIEALKAQACAARNYAITQMGYHSARGYDVCDSTHCQVYIGATYETPSTTLAVDSTDGVLIYYENKPIQAFFFSSSGGYTANSEEVWIEPIPYLKGVKEISEPTAKVWTRTITMSEIDACLTANKVSIGNAVGVSVAKTSPESGRVLELIIHGTNGNTTITKEKIRTFFSSAPGGSLESRLFSLANGAVSTSDGYFDVKGNTSTLNVNKSNLSVIGVNGVLKKLDFMQSYEVRTASGVMTVSGGVMTTSSVMNAPAVTFVGRGWGHGIGLSQHGAKGMAEMGISYVDILKWYYTGVEVK